MSDRPRWWKYGAAYSEVKKCIDDMFLLMPTQEIRNIIGACLGRAQERYPVKIFWVDANMSHLHRGRAPFEGLEENMSRFDQLFFNLLTREVNRHLGRTGCGTIWAGRNRVEECVDDDSLEQQLLYAATNMVKDGLLKRASQNNGFGSYRAIASGDFYERFEYTDWTAWHKAGGSKCKKPILAFKKRVTVTFSKIPSWESKTDAQCATRFRKQVQEIEERCREEQEREGKSAAGPDKLAAMDPRSRPLSPRKRTRQPLCHASTEESANKYRKQWLRFMDERLQASQQFLSGNLYAAFPQGSFRPPLITLSEYAPPSGIS